MDGTPCMPMVPLNKRNLDFCFFRQIGMSKVATDTYILDLRTKYITKLGWFFWFWPIQRYNTTKGKWQILYPRTRYRSKLGWFFWFDRIHVTIRRNLGNEGSKPGKIEACPCKYSYYLAHDSVVLNSSPKRLQNYFSVRHDERCMTRSH